MNENLKDWACSFSGCDGGNINSDIWICGVEWGYEYATDEDRKKYYKTGLSEEIKNGVVKLNSDYDIFNDTQANFNLNVTKLYTAITGEGKGELLKLNLSPIAFRNKNKNLWNDDVIKATGYKTKDNFIKDLDNLSRFKNITNEYNPKLIICVGNTDRDRFKNAFFGNKEINYEYKTIKPEHSNANQNNRYIYYVEHNNILLVVVPFSTQNGLNSDYLLQEAGEKIKELLNA